MRGDYRRFRAIPPRFRPAAELRSPSRHKQVPRRARQRPGAGIEASDFDATETVRSRRRPSRQRRHRSRLGDRRSPRRKARGRADLLRGRDLRAERNSTLADRAVYACGRMVDDYPTAAAMSVPRNALVPVGTFDPSTSEILVTGDQSAAAVAEWLDMRQLDPSELRPGLDNPLTVGKLADPEIKVVVNGSLALEPIRRSGLRRRKANGSALTGGALQRSPRRCCGCSCESRHEQSEDQPASRPALGKRSFSKSLASASAFGRSLKRSSTSEKERSG